MSKLKKRLHRKRITLKVGDIHFETMKHLPETISVKDLIWKIDEMMLKIRPHCGKESFSKEENALLYTMLEEYTDNLSVSTVYGTPSLVVLRKQVTFQERPMAEIIADVNKLIDFANFALS